MTSRIRSTFVIALMSCMALPAWGQQYQLYVPQPVTAGQKTSSQEGILVQEIEIQKGDTLYDLSKKFSGRGMYFPQILLFNSIKNPNLIYTGNILKVPVTQKDAHDSGRVNLKSTGAPLTQKKKSPVKAEAGPNARTTSLPDMKTAGTEKIRPAASARKTAVSAKKKPSPVSSAVSSTSSLALKNKSAAGQKLFDAAVKAYRHDDCSTALELLDRYLADNSGSPLAAEATLYKAECYLKLSAQ